MNELGIVDAVLTDDSDTLLFGAPVVIRKYVLTDPLDDHAGTQNCTHQSAPLHSNATRKMMCIYIDLRVCSPS